MFVTLVTSSKIEIKSEMPCSMCKETGHNKTTCPRKFFADSLVVNLSNTLKYSKPKSKTPNVKANENSNQILNIETSNKITINRTPSGINREAAANSDQSVIKTDKYLKNVNQKSKISSTQMDKSAVMNIGRMTTSVSKRESSRVNLKAVTKTDDSEKVIPIKGVITQSGNKKLVTNSINVSWNLVPPKSPLKVSEITELKSTKKEVTKNWKDIKIENGDKDILCDSAMKRFFDGPTKDEGDGYIYMYTHDSDGKTRQMTKNLPERRIQVLEHDNQEKYVKLHSEKVAWRRLAESLIHKQLTANGHHCPRKDVKGGTEWFKGSKDELLSVIHLVIRFLNIYGLPLQQTI